MKTEDASEAVSAINKTPEKFVINRVGAGSFGIHCLLTIENPSNSILEIRNPCDSCSLAKCLGGGLAILPAVEDVSQTSILLAKAAYRDAKGSHSKGPTISIGMVSNSNLPSQDKHTCIISICRGDDIPIYCFEFTFKKGRSRLEEDAVAGHILLESMGEACEADKIMNSSAYFLPGEKLTKYEME